MSEVNRRINILFPADLLEELEQLVPARKRTQVIVAATAEYVRRLKLRAVLQETAGTWDDDAHPELTTAEDIERWLAGLTTPWRNEPLNSSTGETHG